MRLYKTERVKKKKREVKEQKKSPKNVGTF